MIEVYTADQLLRDVVAHPPIAYEDGCTWCTYTGPAGPPLEMHEEGCLYIRICRAVAEPAKAP